MSTTYTRLVQANADDLHEIGGTLVDTTYLEIGYRTASTNNGLRFTNVTVPNGATINSAKITLKANNNYSNATCKVKIYGVDEDNFSGFGGTVKPSTITKTTAVSNWTIGSWSANTAYDSADISTSVAEITSRAGWASGQAMGFVFIDDSSSASAYRRAIPKNSSATDCPLLTIVYTTAAGPANLKTYNTNATANIKTINTNAISNVKTLNTNA